MMHVSFLIPLFLNPPIRDIKYYYYKKTQDPCLRRVIRFMLVLAENPLINLANVSPNADSVLTWCVISFDF